MTVEEIQMRARLIDPETSGSERRGPTTVLSRREVEEVLARGEYPAELVLDVVRRSEDGEDESGAIAVSWDEAELAELLRASGEDDVMLWFDEDDLERAIEEAEVSAHGLRERAAVLTVAIVAAGATTGSALAQTGASAPRGANSPFLRNVAVPDELPGAASRSAQAAQAGAGATDPAPRGANSPFLRNVAVPDELPASSSADRSSSATAGGEAVPVSATGGGAQLSSGEDAGIAVGAAMLITAAGFGLLRSRRPPEQPA
jgi:hypothetical protein